MATIVTCYFELPFSKHNNLSYNKYNDWIKNMLKINNNMVIFCDAKSLPFIRDLRRDKIDKTKIIEISFQQFYTYKYSNVFLKQYESDPEKFIGHNIFLYMIWNEKSNFLKLAIEMNAFNDDYYLWVDMGCFRYETDLFLNYPNPAKIQQQDKSKVLLLSVIPFTENELNTDYLPDFTKLNRISGTIFGGGKEILLEWHNKYYHMLENFIQNSRFIGKDQTIMNCVYLFNKNMCNLIHSPDICRDKWFYLQDYLCG
jgi:hypothetical protein